MSLICLGGSGTEDVGGGRSWVGGVILESDGKRLHSGQMTCQISSSTGFSIGTISKIHSDHFSDLPNVDFILIL